MSPYPHLQKTFARHRSQACPSHILVQGLEAELDWHKSLLRLLVPFVKVSAPPMVEHSLKQVLQFGWNGTKWGGNYSLLHYAAECVEDLQLFRVIAMLAEDLDVEDLNKKRPVDYAKDNPNQGVQIVLHEMIAASKECDPKQVSEETLNSQNARARSPRRSKREPSIQLEIEVRDIYEQHAQFWQNDCHHYKDLRGDLHAISISPADSPDRVLVKLKHVQSSGQKTKRSMSQAPKLVDLPGPETSTARLMQQPSSLQLDGDTTDPVSNDEQSPERRSQKFDGTAEQLPTLLRTVSASAGKY